MMDTPESNEFQSAAAETERIVREGDEVRQRVRRAVVETVRERRLPMNRVQDLAGQMLGGAIEGARSVAPERRDSVLRETIDGLADGVEATATATRLALEEARGRAETFAQNDVARTVEDLQTLERMFVDVVSERARQAGGRAAEGVKELVDHARRAGGRIGRQAQTALTAAARHPAQFAQEAGSAGAKAAPRAAGALLESMSGLLQGAADLLKGDETEGTEQPEDRR
ncbi:MAG: DUF6781 family protein [Planctomycetota bacterium]|nr:DUF6781 family protein [Planctomycetota bacterium]